MRNGPRELSWASQGATKTGSTWPQEGSTRCEGSPQGRGQHQV